MTAVLTPAMLPPLGAAIVLGAVTALDAAPLAQLLLSQPLPAAVLAGLALHSLGTAAELGVPLQLVWAAALPLGGALIPDSGPAVVGGVTAATLLSRAGAGAWSVPVGFAVALALGPLGARLVVEARRVNHWLVGRAERAVADGDVRGLETAQLAALGVTVARGAVLAGGGALVGLAVGVVLARLLGAHGRAALAAAAAVRWVTPIGLGVLVLSAARRGRGGALGVLLGAAVVLVVLALA